MQIYKSLADKAYKVIVSVKTPSQMVVAIKWYSLLPKKVREDPALKKVLDYKLAWLKRKVNYA